MTAFGQRERLPIEIGNRNVRGQAQLAGEALEAHVIRSVQVSRNCFRPTEARFTGNAYPRRALQRFHDAKDLGGAKGAVVLYKARREIHHAKGARGGSEYGLQNIGVFQVRLLAGFAIRPADDKLSTFFRVQQRGKYRLGIKTRQAAPDNFAVALNKRGNLAIADQSKVFEKHAIRVANWG